LRANRLALITILIFCLVPSLPVRCEDGESQDWWSNLWGSVTNALSGAGQWINENIVQPVSNAVSGAGQWINDAVVQPVSDAVGGAVETVKTWISGAGEAVSNAVLGTAETVNNAISGAGEAISKIPETVSDWWYWNVQKPIGDWWSGYLENQRQQIEQLQEQLTGTTEEEATGGSEEEGAGGTTWIDEITYAIDRYFSGGEDVVEIGEEGRPTGETGLDFVNDIWDVDFPTLWLGWDITFPWGQRWAVGVDLMAPFESAFNKAAEVSFEIFFKKPVGLMWSVWSGTYKICRNTGLAAPFAVTAAAGVEVGVGITLVMILQKIIDVIL